MVFFLEEMSLAPSVLVPLYILNVRSNKQYRSYGNRFNVSQVADIGGIGIGYIGTCSRRTDPS